MLILVTNMLNNVTLPKSVGSHFPADLNTANQVTNDVISILRESIMESVPLSLNMVNEYLFLLIVVASSWSHSPWSFQYNYAGLIIGNRDWEQCMGRR